MSQLVDQLAHLARNAESPPLDDTAAHRMITRALVASARPVVAHRAPLWPLAVAAAAIIVVLAWPRSETRPALALSHVTLPTGDRLAGTPGARFDIESLAPADRRLRLRGGTMLFDVAHVVAGQRFEVATDQVTVVAKGTVFSVTTDAVATRVYVYEGAVDVIEAGRAHAVSVGEAWSTGGHAVETAAIAVEAQSAVVARASEAPKPVDVPGITAKDAKEPRTPEEPTIRRAERAEKPLPVAPLASSGALGGNSSPTDPRTLIASGDYAGALALLQHRDLDGPGYLLLADALRGLHRTAEAADALDVAVGKLAGAARLEASYSSAYLRFHDLHDADAALAALAPDLDDLGSPFAERGLALRAQILASLHRDADAAEAATHYLERFPHGDLARYMQSLAKK